MHVTTKVVAGLPNLRVKSVFRAVRAALLAGADRFGFRLVHYSVQRDHLHLIVEADDKVALRRGMVGLQVRLARQINKIAGRSGRVFVDRYHLQVLRSPTQVAHALRYLFDNGRKHARQRGVRMAEDWLDPCSTAGLFHRLRRGLVEARSWLLGAGWKKGIAVEPEAA